MIEKSKRNVTVIQDADGNRIVMINDILFKGRRSIEWQDVERYLKQYVGEVFSIIEDDAEIYIGRLPVRHCLSTSDRTAYPDRCRAALVSGS